MLILTSRECKLSLLSYHKENRHQLKSNDFNSLGNAGCGAIATTKSGEIASGSRVTGEISLSSAGITGNVSWKLPISGDADTLLEIECGIA